MSIPLTIQGQVIQFPSDSQDPDWAPGIIAFAQAVATALQGVAGTYDVSPQIFTLDSYNPGVNVAIPLLNFPVSNVRSVIVYYSLYRSTSSANAGDAGQLQLAYIPSNGTGNKWEIIRQGTDDSGGGITFTVTDAGQVQFTTNTLAGTGHSGKLSYSAKALQYV